MSQLFTNCHPYWNSNDQQISESLSKNLSLKVDSPLQLRQSNRSLGFHLQDHDSSSSQSTQSNHDLTATARTNSQDQCISSESGQEVNCDKNVGLQTKSIYLMGQPDPASFSAGHIDYNRTMTCMPYPYADPYFNGLLTSYGPTPVTQPQMIGVTNARVPLPLDHISEDEPIYVNAKQYHGILRRRQSRAKMEAQNKLIKLRKPYLHESRHLHALNRVRGSGGRFLSTKKSQQPESSSAKVQSIQGPNHKGNNLIFEPQQQSLGRETGTTNVSHGGGDVSFYQHPDHGLPGFSSAHTGVSMQRNGSFMDGSNQHHAPVVR